MTATVIHSTDKQHSFTEFHTHSKIHRYSFHARRTTSVKIKGQLSLKMVMNPCLTFLEHSEKMTQTARQKHKHDSHRCLIQAGHPPPPPGMPASPHNVTLAEHACNKPVPLPACTPYAMRPKETQLSNRRALTLTPYTHPIWSESTIRAVPLKYSPQALFRGHLHKDCINLALCINLLSTIHSHLLPNVS